MENQTSENQPQAASEGMVIDLQALSAAAERNGPQWGLASEQLNLTVLSWSEQSGVAAHVNNEVDVVLIGVEGAGEVRINGQTFTLTGGKAVLIPKGAERAIKSTSERFSYLSLHQRRRGLMPQ